MIKTKHIYIGVLLFCSIWAFSQAPAESSVTGPAEPNAAAGSLTEIIEEPPTGFEKAAESIHQQLADSVAELNALREQIANEQIPLSRTLNDLEGQLVNVRAEYQQASRLLDSRTLDLSNLRSEIRSRKEEATYLSNLLSEYTRNFESRLHIAELQRYRDALETAKLAVENSNLSEEDIYKAQANLLSVSLDRLEGALGGTRFDGTATDSSGSIHHGTFILIGPAAIFQSDDGKNIGTAEQRLGSLEPTVIEFSNPADAEAASEAIFGSTGQFPLDPTLGNAHKVEQIKQTVWDEVQKGGMVMYPIFGLAGLALLVALLKLLGIMFTKMLTPSKKRIRSLLDSVAEHDEASTHTKADKLKGPIGEMLRAGVKHLEYPRELIEEVMYEKVMAARLKLERFLPFVAISAAAAPLLGLLGTVTGIIKTFALLTVFGSGDVKSLSGGISEALITTKYGLIVAIPSLLIHALLSRMARGVVNDMEKSAVALANQITKTPYYTEPPSAAFAGLTADQVRSLLKDLNPGSSQTVSVEGSDRYSRDYAGGLMSTQIISVDKDATVADAIKIIRQADIGDDVDVVFVVDDQGKFAGHVLVRHLLMRSEQDCIESLADTNRLFVRVDSHKDEVKELFQKHDLINVPVLDHSDQIVGRIVRNGNGDWK